MTTCLHERAVTAAWEVVHSPNDPIARFLVQEAWLALGCDYFATLAAVVTRSDQEARSPIDARIAMEAIASAASKAVT